MKDLNSNDCMRAYGMRAQDARLTCTFCYSGAASLTGFYNIMQINFIPDLLNNCKTFMHLLLSSVVSIQLQF
jgi:hypothetical protein